MISRYVTVRSEQHFVYGRSVLGLLLACDLKFNILYMLLEESGG